MHVFRIRICSMWIRIQASGPKIVSRKNSYKYMFVNKNHKSVFLHLLLEVQQVFIYSDDR